jgi:carboxyl-terminal processing protease
VSPACAGVPLATMAPGLYPTGAPPLSPPLDTEAQLGVLGGLENAVRNLYLYPDFGGVDWPAAVAETRVRVEAGMDTEAFYRELQELISGLGDEHSYIQTPAEIAAERAALEGQLDFVGIGVFVLPRIERGLGTILSVFPESPADHGGLRPHDSILRIDGTPIVEGGVSQQQLMRGPACSQIVLTVQTPGQPEREVSFVRSAVSGALPIDARLVPTSDGSRVGYIFLPTFLDQSWPERVEQALQDFGPLDGLILDDRMNGGGLGSVAEAMLAFFVDGPAGFYLDNQGRSALSIAAHPVHNSQNVPLVVLIDEDTVSFGEIFAGVLQDLGRAKLVGQTTLGNVERLHAADFDDGSRLWLAVERFDPLNSQANWEEQGIVPDVPLTAAWEDFMAENDPAVMAALQLLALP